MSRYFHQETETNPECLTAEGERRLFEIQVSYRRNAEKVESLFEDDGDLIAKAYIDSPEPAALWIEVTSRLQDRYEDDAMKELREEDSRV